MAAPSVKDLNKRWGILKTERASWITHWGDITSYILPRSGRYFVTDHNKGWKRNNAIYDSTGTKALRVLSAGMMSGMTSPSRPWFRLSVTDRQLMEYQPVKQWLNDVTELIQDIFARSNTYRVLHMMYEELGAFGTAAAMITEDYENVIHLHPFTVGEYAIATNWKGEVVTLYREFEKTVADVVTEFGIENVSIHVKSAYERGDLDRWLTIRHAIEPRTDRDSTKIDNKNMPWGSYYWEASNGDGKLLRESGYKSFRVVAPRWQAQGGDIYGNSPGMDALGDIKQLQTQQFRKSQAIDYQANPPIQVPSSMKNREIETFPGGISYYDASAGTQGIKNAFEVNLNLQTLLLDIQDVRTRINGAFYADLFLMIAQTDGRMTATEVAARNEEKMLMLGPVVERLGNELLDPLVEITFEIMADGGLLPPPPEEMQGHDLNIEYTSILAQAQKAVSVNGIDRYVASMVGIAQFKPEVLDTFDADRWVNIYSDKLGVDPELILPQDKVDVIRQSRAQQMATAQKQAAMQQGSEVVKNLGQASTQPGTAAGDAMQMMGIGGQQ